MSQIEVKPKPKGFGELKFLVFATDITLSERFKKLPSHNPLRPNMEAKYTVVNEKEEKTSGFAARKPFQDLEFLNMLPGVKSAKEIEVLRLRAQLRAAQLRLIASNSRKEPGQRGGRDGRVGGGRKAGGGGRGRGNGRVDGGGRASGRRPRGDEILRLRVDSLPKKGQQGANMVKRIGGGVNLQHGGKNLAICSQDSARQYMSSKKSNNGKSSKSKGRKGKDLSLFGSSKSRADLDKELDAYMSKSKNKQKDSLDEELEEYMAAAARARAEKASASTVAPATSSAKIAPATAHIEINIDMKDSEMEIDG